MPTYEMIGVDGNTYQIDGPNGMDRAAVEAEIIKRAPQAGGPKYTGVNTSQGIGTSALNALKSWGASTIGAIANVDENFPKIAIEGLRQGMETAGNVFPGVSTAVQLSTPYIDKAAKAINKPWAAAVAPVTQPIQKYMKEVEENAPRGTPPLAEAQGFGGKAASLAESVGRTVPTLATAFGLTALTRNPEVGMAMIGGTSFADTFKNVRDMQAQAGKDDIHSAVSTALASAAMNTFGGVGGSLTGMGKEFTIRMLEKEAERSAIKHAAKTAAEQSLIGGAQTYMEREAGGQDVTSPQARQEVIENAIVGALTGGLFGGVVEGKRSRDVARVREAVKDAPAIATVDVDLPGGKQKLDIISGIDKDGNVAVRKANGDLQIIPVQHLAELRTPETRAPEAPPVDLFSKGTITERINTARGDVDKKGVVKLANEITQHVVDSLEAGKPEDIAAKIPEWDALISKSKGPNANTDVKRSILHEAKSILTDYYVEQGKEKAQPGVEVGPAAPDATVTLTDMIQRNAQRKLEDFAARTALEKESALETAHGIAEESIQKQQKEGRFAIINPLLEDPTIPLENKIAKVNAKLGKEGFNPLNETELKTLQMWQDAHSVFGPEGEFQKKTEAENARRAEAMKEIMSDPQVQDKYKAFTELADREGMAPPTPEEIAAMRGDAMPVREALPKTQVKDEYTLPEEVPPPVEPAPREPTFREKTRVDFLTSGKEARAAELTGEPPTKYREGEGGVGIAPDVARARVDELTSKWKAGLKVNTVGSLDELPENIRADVVADKMEGAQGFVGKDGQVYLLAHNMNGPADVTATLYHESLGHVGLSDLFQERLNAALNEFYNRNAKIKAEADAWRKSNPDAYTGDADPLARAVEEVLARRSESGQIEIGIWNRLKAIIRDFGRRMGMNLEYSDDDIKAILARAHARVTGGVKTSEATGNRYMFTGFEARMGSERYYAKKEAERRKNEGENVGPGSAVHSETGWFQGQDGKWRFEVSDEGAKLVNWDKVPVGRAGLPRAPNEVLRLDQVFSHPTLFAQYPDLRHVKVEKTPAKNDIFRRRQGWFNPVWNTIYVSPHAKDPLSTMLHEIQHWVQERENFARGGNEEVAINLMNHEQLQRAKDRVESTLTSERELAAREVEAYEWAKQSPEVQAYADALRKTLRAYREYKDSGIEKKDETLKQEWIAATYNLGQAKIVLMDELFGHHDFNSLNRATQLEWDKLNNVIRGDIDTTIAEGVDKIKDIQNRINALQTTDNAVLKYELRKTNEARYAYLAMLGEIEARATESRRDYSDFARAMSHPYSAEGIPEEDYIISGITNTSYSTSEDNNRNPNRPQAAEDAINDWKRRFVRGISDKFEDATQLEKKRAKLAGVARRPSDVNIAQTFEAFDPAKGGQQFIFDRNYFQPITKTMRKLNLSAQDVGLYLWARAAPDRNRIIRERTEGKVKDGAGMTDAEAHAYMNELQLRGLTPKLEQVAKIHDALIDRLLNYRVEHGLMSRAEATHLRKEQPFYAALKGNAADGDMQTDEGRSPHEQFAEAMDERQQKGISAADWIKAKGRGSEPFNPLFNAFEDANRATFRAGYNEMGNVLARDAAQDPEGTKRLFKIWSKDNNKSGMSIRELEQAARDSRNHEFFMFKKDGQPHFIQFAKNGAGYELSNAFANLTPPKINWVWRAAGKATSFFNSLHTWRNPAFLPRALKRDLGDVLSTADISVKDKTSPAYGTKLNTRVRNYILNPKEAGPAMKDIFTYLRGDEPTTDHHLLIEQMIEDGGAMLRGVFGDAETHAQTYQKNMRLLARMQHGDPTAFLQEGMKMFESAMEGANQYADILGRYATYRAALDEGLDRKDAAHLARNSSLNLTRRGEWAHITNVLYPFFSVNVEGARKWGGKFVARQGLRLATKMATAGALVTLYNLAMSGDEDQDGRNDYLDIPAYSRATSLILKYGTGSEDYVKIPIGYMGAFPKYFGEQALLTSLGYVTPKEAAYSSASALMNSFSPVQFSGDDPGSAFVSALPATAIGKPMVDLAMNQNYFGSSIYNTSSFIQKPESQQGRETTGPVYKWIAAELNKLTGGTETVGGGLDIHPEAFKYIADQLGGGMFTIGKDIRKLVVGEAEGTLAQKMPVVNKYVGTGSKYIPANLFYKNTRKFGSSTMDQIAAAERDAYNTGDFSKVEENQRQFPLETNPVIMEAYKSALDALKYRREQYNQDRQNISDREQLKILLEDYQRDRNNIYSEFNRTYNSVKKELGK